jgi:hypothetical protein
VIFNSIIKQKALEYRKAMAAILWQIGVQQLKLATLWKILVQKQTDRRA